MEIQWREVIDNLLGIDEVTSDWKEYTLEDLAEIHSHKRVPLSSMERAKLQGSYPYYGASGIIDSVHNFIFDGEYVLISEDGENLKTRNTPIAFIASGQFWVNNHAHVIKGKKPYLNRLLCYYFANLDLNPFLTGAAQPKLNKGALLSIPIILPESEAEQRAIAGILSSLDDKIDLLYRQNATLEALAETLFRQWFVEDAKQEWEERKVGDIANHLKVGINPVANPTVMYCQYSLPAYDNGQVPTRELGLEILSNKYEVTPNTILISKLNPRFPRIWAIGESVADNSVCSTEFQVFKPKKQSLYAYFYFLIKSEDVVGEMTMAASGTSGSHQRIRPEDILNIKVRIPSIEKAEEFSTIAQGFIDKVDKNRGVIQTLSTLRDTLLPKLMSGEVRVAY